MKNRILSVALALCMVLTLMPVTAFAASGENCEAASCPAQVHVTYELADAPGTFVEKCYYTEPADDTADAKAAATATALTGALTAVGSGTFDEAAKEGTLKVVLLNDAAVDTLTVEQSVTLDLGGKTLKAQVTVNASGEEVTIQNGSIKADDGALTVTNGDVTLVGVTVLSTNESGCAASISGGELTIDADSVIGDAAARDGLAVNGGTVTIEGTVAADTNGVDVTGEAVVTIKGAVSAATTGVIVNNADATVTVDSGAAITGETALSVADGTVAVNGGTITGTTAAVVVTGTPTVDLNGATFKGAITSVVEKIVNAGGTYDAKVAQNLINAYDAETNATDVAVKSIIDNGDGTYTYSNVADAGTDVNATTILKSGFYADKAAAAVAGASVAKNQSLEITLNQVLGNSKVPYVKVTGAGYTWAWELADATELEVSFLDITTGVKEWTNKKDDVKQPGLIVGEYDVELYAVTSGEAPADDAEPFATTAFEYAADDVITIKNVAINGTNLEITLSRAVDDADYDIKLGSTAATSTDGKVWTVAAATGKVTVMDAYVSTIGYAEQDVTVRTVTLTWTSDLAVDKESDPVTAPTSVLVLNGGTYKLPVLGTDFWAADGKTIDGWFYNGSKLNVAEIVVTSDMTIVLTAAVEAPADPETGILDTPVFTWGATNDIAPALTVKTLTGNLIPYGETWTLKVLKGEEVIHEASIGHTVDMVTTGYTLTFADPTSNTGKAYVEAEDVLTIELTTTDGTVSKAEYEVVAQNATVTLTPAYTNYEPAVGSGDAIEASLTVDLATDHKLTGSYVLSVKNAAGETVATYEEVLVDVTGVAAVEYDIDLGLAAGADLAVGNYTVEIALADADGAAFGPALAKATFSVVLGDTELALANAGFVWNMNADGAADAYVAAGAEILDVVADPVKFNATNVTTNQTIWVTLNREVDYTNGDRAYVEVALDGTMVMSEAVSANHNGAFELSFLTKTADIAAGTYTVTLYADNTKAEQLGEALTVTVDALDSYVSMTAKSVGANIVADFAGQDMTGYELTILKSNGQILASGVAATAGVVHNFTPDVIYDTYTVVLYDGNDVKIAETTVKVVENIEIAIDATEGSAVPGFYTRTITVDGDIAGKLIVAQIISGDTTIYSIFNASDSAIVAYQEAGSYVRIWVVDSLESVADGSFVTGPNASTDN